MDNNPPDNTESKDKSKHDQVKPETLSSSYNKKIFKLLKLLVGVVTGAGITMISFSISNTNTNVNVNALSNAIATMATSLSNADAKSDSQAIVHNNTFPLGSGNATIYHKFQNPVQACWYYAATYRTQHPYTVLWEKHSKEHNLKIRVIADRGIWKAHTCRRDNEVDLEKIKKLLREGDARIEENDIEDILKIAKDYKNITDVKEIENKIKDNINKFRIIGLIHKPDTIVKLIGEETINHRLEAQFETENNYSHIANTVATYYSTLHFDNEGKITHRRVKEVGDKEYECIFPDSDSLKSLSDDDKFKNLLKNSCSSLTENTGEYKNIVEILNDSPIAAMTPLKKEYLAALSFYLEERKKLHQNLTYDGCGAISVEPDFVTGDLPTGELETPSLVFLCHKNNIRSHVRIMVRENQQQKKEREEDKTRS